MVHHSLVIIPDMVLVASNIIAVSIEKNTVAFSLRYPVYDGAEGGEVRCVFLRTKSERIARDCVKRVCHALRKNVDDVDLTDMVN